MVAGLTCAHRVARPGCPSCADHPICFCFSVRHLEDSRVCCTSTLAGESSLTSFGKLCALSSAAPRQALFVLVGGVTVSPSLLLLLASDASYLPFARESGPLGHHCPLRPPRLADEGQVLDRAREDARHREAP